MPEKLVAEPPVKADPKFVRSMTDKFKSAMATMPPETKPAATEKPAVAEPKPPAEIRGVPELKSAKVEPKQIVTKPVEVKTDKGKLASENFAVVIARAEKAEKLAADHERKVQEYETKLAELTTKVPADLEDKLKSLTTYEQLVQQFYVEHSPQFKKAFDDKIAAAKAELKESITGETGQRLAELLEADVKPGKWRDEQIKALAEDLSDFDKIGLNNIYKDLKRLEKERAVELAKSGENYQKLTAAEREQITTQQTAREQTVDKALRHAIQDAAEQFTDFKSIDGNTEHNALVEQNKSLAKQFLAPNLKPEDQSRVAVWAVKGYRSAETDALKDALISKLQTQIQELQGANPNLTGGGERGADKGGQKPSPGQKFRQALETGIPKQE